MYQKSLWLTICAGLHVEDMAIFPKGCYCSLTTHCFREDAEKQPHNNATPLRHAFSYFKHVTIFMILILLLALGAPCFTIREGAHAPSERLAMGPRHSSVPSPRLKSAIQNTVNDVDRLMNSNVARSVNH